MPNLAARLDVLLDAYRAAGLDPSRNLKPGLSEAEIGAVAAQLGVVFPQAVRELYRWRNGVADLYAEFDKQFVFRDQPFLSLDNAQDAIADVRAILKEAQAFSGAKDALLDPANLIPIAAFEGFYYVVPGGDGLSGLPVTHPVISIGEGEDVYFLTVESMIETCIEWISDPSLDKETLSAENEEDAWERHNPGVFELELE